MNPEILKEVEDQLAKLPKKIREVITSIDISSEISTLRTKHNLMLDQISTLELETMLTMIGLQPADEFADNIKDSLHVDSERAESIAADINNSIFNKIRQAMMASDEAKETQEEPLKEHLDKESILAEIENPTPTFGSNLINNQPTSKDNLPEVAPLNVVQKYTPPIQTKSIAEKKLTEPTHIPPKETEIFLKKLPQSEEIKSIQKPAFDPYKEPLD